MRLNRTKTRSNTILRIHLLLLRIHITCLSMIECKQIIHNLGLHPRRHHNSSNQEREEGGVYWYSWCEGEVWVEGGLVDGRKRRWICRTNCRYDLPSVLAIFAYQKNFDFAGRLWCTVFMIIWSQILRSFTHIHDVTHVNMLTGAPTTCCQRRINIQDCFKHWHAGA